MERYAQNNGKAFFSIEKLMNLIKRGKLVVPNYQRGADAWDEKKKQRFIVSILCDFPVPEMYFFYEDGLGGTAEVGDGQQRLRAIQEFMDDRFALSRMIDTISIRGGAVNGHKKQNWRGMTFSDLPDAAQQQIKDYEFTICRLAVSTAQEKIQMFELLNVSPTPLNNAEIRNAVYDSQFLELVIRGHQKDPTAFCRATGTDPAFTKRYKAFDLLCLALAVDEFQIGGGSTMALHKARNQLLAKGKKASAEEMRLAAAKIHRLFENSVTIFGENNVGAFGFRGNKVRFKTHIWAALAPSLMNTPIAVVKEYQAEIQGYYNQVFKDSALQAQCAAKAVDVEFITKIRAMWERGQRVTKDAAPVYIMVKGKQTMVKGFSAIINGKNPMSSKIFKDPSVIITGSAG